MTTTRLVWVVAAAGVVACASATDVATPATVTFVIDAPLCSSVIPVQFSIDGHVVGIDTFRVALANPHTSSREFTTPAGSHTLSAQTVAGYVWPAKDVTLGAGQAVTDSLPFYCS
jgi:hypothetical protein